MFSVKPMDAHHRPRLHRRQHRSYASARAILTRYGYQFPQDFRLGHGRYSKVFKAFHSGAGAYFAIKVTDMERVSDRFKRRFIPRELAIWRVLDHPNIVHLHMDFNRNGFLFEILDLAVGGDMFSYLNDHGPKEEYACRGWMHQLINGLIYLHQNRIVHRDLKLENILIFEDGVIKIGDFGFCKQCDDDADLSSTFCGTKPYKAPEVLMRIDYDPFKADVWAFGVVCFIMLTDRMPFTRDADNSQIVEEQRNRNYRFPSRLALSEQCRASIDAILTFDPLERPSVFEIRTLPWFDYSSSSDDGFAGSS